MLLYLEAVLVLLALFALRLISGEAEAPPPAPAAKKPAKELTPASPRPKLLSTAWQSRLDDLLVPASPAKPAKPAAELRTTTADEKATETVD